MRAFSQSMYSEWVKVPQTREEIATAMAPFKALGLHGAIASCDVVHIPWGACPAAWTNLHTGKEKVPTLAYQVCVDHLGSAISSTSGFPGSMNDKAIVRFDKFITGVRERRLFNDVSYTLRVLSEDGASVIDETVTGPYIIVDGGYHKWWCLQCPFKHATDPDQVAWSKWVESVRKDVECFFGRLKARFRVLKRPIELRKKEQVDNLFFCCIIVQNMLHAYDGMDVWEAGVDLDNENVDNENDDVEPQLPAPSLRTQSRGADTTVDVEEEKEKGYFDLRRKLVQNFAERNRDGVVTWVRS